MSSETKKEILQRGVVVVECFAVVVAYVGIVGLLLYPALDAASLLV